MQCWRYLPNLHQSYLPTNTCPMFITDIAFHSFIQVESTGEIAACRLKGHSLNHAMERLTVKQEHDVEEQFLPLGDDGM